MELTAQRKWRWEKGPAIELELRTYGLLWSFSDTSHRSGLRSFVPYHPYVPVMSVPLSIEAGTVCDVMVAGSAAASMLHVSSWQRPSGRNVLQLLINSCVLLISEFRYYQRNYEPLQYHVAWVWAWGGSCLSICVFSEYLWAGVMCSVNCMELTAQLHLRLGSDAYDTTVPEYTEFFIGTCSMVWKRAQWSCLYS